MNKKKEDFNRNELYEEIIYDYKLLGEMLKNINNDYITFGMLSDNEQEIYNQLNVIKIKIKMFADMTMDFDIL